MLRAGAYNEVHFSTQRTDDMLPIKYPQRLQVGRGAGLTSRLTPVQD